MTVSLATAVRTAALELPPGDIAAMAAAFDRHWRPTTSAREDIVGAVATERYRQRASGVFDTWADELPGMAVALALRTAADTAAAARSEQVVEIAWTGPQTMEVALRATKPVLLEVIAAARHRLVLVSFAAYKVADVVGALRVARGRGVDIRLVLETAEDSGGKLSHDGAVAFKTLGESVSLWTWPADLRPHSASGALAALHVKAAVADDTVAFVTSANLTDWGLSENMELGLLVRGGGVPHRLAAHFRQMMDDGVLTCLAGGQSAT
jgi:phosphatidylserine/phosphatidylglycerophosphate/cardiolipin synthase-like enzyme